MSKRLSTSTARAQFSEVISRAQFRGERTILHRRNQPVAAIVPINDLRLLQRLEDQIDIEDALRALKEPRGKSWQQLRKELGL